MWARGGAGGASVGRRLVGGAVGGSFPFSQEDRIAGMKVKVGEDR